jgi:uncharacterized membrane protein YjjP (DUF1212 family)
MDKEQFLRRVKFIMKFARALHAVGSPAHTLESTLQEMCQLFEIKGNIVSLPTAIFCSFSHGDEEVTKIERVIPVGVNLGKLSKVDLVAREVIIGQMSYEEGSQSLDRISDGPDPYGRKLRLLCYIFSTAGFMVLFGGTWGDFMASIVIGSIIGLLSLLQPAQSIGLVAQLFEAIVAIAAAFCTTLLAQAIPSINAGVVILSSLIIFMPGLFITIAIAEIATQNLTSGTSRLMGGIMILLKLAFGVFVGAKIARYFSMPNYNFEFMTIPGWITVFTLPVTALMATIIFKAEKADWIWVTVAGILGYGSSKIGSYFFGPEMGILFGGFLVGASSNIFARLKDRPSSLFQFPGIILLVPGSMGYRSMNYLFEQDVVGGLGTAFGMVILAMSLVVGIFLGNIIIKPRRSIRIN